jgi:hypothetical protein
METVLKQTDWPVEAKIQADDIELETNQHWCFSYPPQQHN